MDDLETKIVNLVIDASDNEISVSDLDAADGSLELAGLSSLSFLILIELLEAELGVIVNPEADPDRLMSIAGITDFVRTQLVA